MAEAKTKPSALSVDEYLANIDDEERRSDCMAIATLMQAVTKQPPVMWGTSIVGFGHYRYTYESGHSGESCRTGFSSRKGDISIYLMASSPEHTDLLSKLGKHKMGKSCLYVRRLSEIDIKILKKLIASSYKEMKARYGDEG